MSSPRFADLSEQPSAEFPCSSPPRPALLLDIELRQGLCITENSRWQNGGLEAP